jgi:siroheme synthase-like protein
VDGGRWYPLNLDLRGRRCLVVGGGAVALDKIRELVSAGALVTVVAPELADDVAALHDQAGVTLVRRAYLPVDLDGAWFAVTATDDPAVNAAVHADGEARRIFVNAADDPANCSAILPARVRRGDLLVTFSTGGASPALSAWLRRRGEIHYGPEYGALVALVAEVRRDRKAQGLPSQPRGWQEALDSGILDLVRQGRTTDAKELLDACLSSSSA